ncbi:MAG: hypothetical protein ACHQ1G_04040 [Planctomycetota bacterium]
MRTGRNDRSPSSFPRAAEAAFSLLEILCGMSLMFVGLLALAGSTAQGMATMQTSRESAQAMQAARRFIETMQTGEVPFEGLFVAYARNPLDLNEGQLKKVLGGATEGAGSLLEGVGSPLEGTRTVTEGAGTLLEGAGTLTEGTPGVRLGAATEALQPVLSRSFAVPGLKPRSGDADGTIGELIFPVAQGAEGLELREDVAKRDLNGDGVIDTEDHSNDYVILPVTVKVEWKGTRGTRQIELHSLLVRR